MHDQLEGNQLVTIRCTHTFPPVSGKRCHAASEGESAKVIMSFVATKRGCAVVQIHACSPGDNLGEQEGNAKAKLQKAPKGEFGSSIGNPIRLIRPCYCD